MSLRGFSPILVLLVAVLCSCGAGSRQTTAGALQSPALSDALPPLPTAEDVVAERIGSVVRFETIQGDQWDSASPGVQVSGDDAQLFAAPDGLEWAIYRLPGAEENFKPQSVTRQLAAQTGILHMAVANYARGRWEIVSSSGLLAQTFEYGTAWQDYVSPAGNLYCALISAAENVQLDYVYFSVDDNIPPAVPQNLSASPGELSASLSWDAVMDSRVSELRIYHSLADDMNGATLLGTVPVGETAQVYDGLDYNFVHYFTIRSYSTMLAQESADSNIASCQPTEPVVETFLPPTNLTASPGPGSASLSWDAYPDARASHIRVYSSLNSDMSSPVLEAELDAALIGYTVEGLTSGTTYYFAVKAWWESALIESEFSNIDSCIPVGIAFELMDGIWPRYGGDMTSSGYSPQIGPADLLSAFKASLTDGSGLKCRTSPVIGSDGRVYAVSSDAQLSCYSADLATRHWRTDANIALSDVPGAFLLAVFAQAPILDNLGNIYFVATEDNDSLSGNGWALSFDKDGNYRWKVDLGTLPLDQDIPVANMNISPDGALLCYVDDSSALYALDRDGNLLWDNIDDSNLSRHFYTDIAMNGSGQIGQPTFLTDIWIDPRPHWLSFSSVDGSKLQQHDALGGSSHIFGGIFMPNGYFYYPSGAAMLGLDPSDGSQIDSNTLLVNAVGAPARDGAGSYMFFAEDQGGGFSGFASFHCVSFTDDAVPQMQTEYGVSLGLVTASGKPAIDSQYTAYFADGDGIFHRIGWDPSLPIGEGNPVHTSTDLGVGIVYSSVALGDNVAYVIGQNNTLFLIGGPAEI